MKINELKHDLAAAFRWTARLNMNEGIANHYSVCLPNSNDFYVNGSGLHFSSIKASDMVLVEQDKIEEIKNNPELVDPTALNIHGTIHRKVPHARCILHVHSKYATALSTLKDPVLKPIDQNTMRFFNRISTFNDFGGLGFEEESNKMASAIGNNSLLLLANHGILTVGQTVADAFDKLYYFEKACETYMTALSTNAELNVVDSKIAEKTAQEWENYPVNMGQQHLDEIKKILDKEDISYRE
ncbi:class II aldolase/adducin family protein [Candidatus Pelagibacter sp.]|jgi:ribulose-5-phosphate 4-epimerase/fuculose-1-phosphate aldolase|nr:class II aldolase/adducin family protein [Candidatus Pelagibacter sp.]MDA9678582.1 class II aldolase/adducin family protein [Candidatus Pelagibacter sp.]MDA9960805.1 class II aldolase/adducin family protein [Candidatus Pelagibacter sp.]MDB9922691.1 class II aldolase/adducin family protein [Candidatus Pelagibacter sp.]|tara:strand:+ start:627 stop:1352 length:726 start_codon:yes stop_codon:yes gene_type:complete